MASKVPETPPLDYDQLQQRLSQASTDAALFKQIVNAPFEQRAGVALMFLGIMVLLQVNPKTGQIDRVALSDTDMARSTTNVSMVPFSEIKIDANHPDNIIAEAIRKNKPQYTTDWKYLFIPALTAEQARINQASAGIACSVVYPLKARNGGALIYSYFQYKEFIGKNQHDFMRRYTALVDEQLKVKY